MTQASNTLATQKEYTSAERLAWCEATGNKVFTLDLQEKGLTYACITDEDIAFTESCNEGE